MQTLKSPDNPRVLIHLSGICRKCKVWHDIEAEPDSFGRLAFDWQYKHRACELEKPGSVDFITPRRQIPKNFNDRVFNDAGLAPWWLNWKENADIKTAYTTYTALTFNLSNLASSSSFTAGIESSVIDNSTLKYLDVGITGKFISGTTPTAPAEHRLYYIRRIDNTPTWPDVFDATSSAETVTNSNILDTLPMAWSGTASTSTNITYPVVNALSAAQAFGFCPEFFLLFFAHAHTAALKTDAGNTDQFMWQGIYATT